MNDAPAFDKWDTTRLIEFCQEAFDTMLAQQDTIIQLRLDVRKLMRKLEEQDKDDWK